MSDVRVRLAKPEDAEAVRALYAPYVERTAITFETVVPDVAEFGRRIEKAMSTHVWLVAERARVLLGFAYATRFRDRVAYDWSCECSIYIAQAEHGRGLGRMLYRELLSVLRLLGLRRFFGIVTLPNEASRRLHESFGFVEAGVWQKVGYKLGGWHDVGVWQLCEEASEPAHLRKLADLVSVGAWQAGNEVTVFLAPFRAWRSEIMSIREEVFVREQGVPPELERDGADESASHALLAVDGRCVATGRLLPEGRIGRVAVVSDQRQRGYGARITRLLIEAAKRSGLSRVTLHAQVSSFGFYDKLGFLPYGERFIEAGIEHRAMQLALE